MLRDAELLVLTVLSKNPLGDVKSLSKQARLSPATFAKNLKKLRTNGILGWDQDKDHSFGFVSAQICPSAVGLQQVAITMIGPHEKWKKAEEMCDIHPYTTYRTRCYGAINGIFALFALPSNSFYLLIELLEAMKEKKTLSDIIYSTAINKELYTETNFQLYDHRAGTWNLDWNEWKLEKKAYPLEPCPPSVLDKMDAVDIKILRQLSIDARKEKQKIASEVGIEAYSLSRRLSFYGRNNVIAGYRLLYGSSSLNLVTPALVECRAAPQTKAEIAYLATRLPYQGNFISTEKGLILYSTLPAPDFPRLADAILEYTDDANLLWCDYTSSVRYWFDSADKSSFKDGRWLATREYMVDNVLKELGLN